MAIAILSNVFRRNCIYAIFDINQFSEERSISRGSASFQGAATNGDLPETVPAAQPAMAWGTAARALMAPCTAAIMGSNPMHEFSSM